ncbi:MAG TPA: response regulator [Geobacteraceae bacterium]|nr:response regulator [Geobacteraceae bacterium]
MKEIDILVADDEPHIVRALSFIFNREGLRVETASDGEEALHKCRNFAPRVAFFDLIMPRIDGLQLCREIKSDGGGSHPYVIILTCKGQDVDRENCLKAGANEFMTKPFSPNEVLAKVKSLLGR